MTVPKHILPIYADEVQIEQRKTKKHRSFLYIITGLMILSSIVGSKFLFSDTVSQRQLQSKTMGKRTGCVSIACCCLSLACIEYNPRDRVPKFDADFLQILNANDNQIDATITQMIELYPDKAKHITRENVKVWAEVAAEHHQRQEMMTEFYATHKHDQDIIDKLCAHLSQAHVKVTKAYVEAWVGRKKQEES